MDDVDLFRCLTGQADRDDVAAVTAWRQASAGNERRYRELESLLRAVSANEAMRRVGDPPPVDEILQPARPRVPGQPRTRRTRSLWPSVAAAAVLVISASSYWWAGRPTSDAAPPLAVDKIVTGAAETATVELLDGTVVRVAPRSRLEVVPVAGERVVALEGRAYFAVAKKAGSLFRIRTQAGEVTVTGTRFDLQAQSRNLRLIVVEGRVILSSRQTETAVTAGEMARVVAGTPAPVVRVPEVGPMIDWVGGFMAFQATPLKEAAREIERRFSVRVDIADSALASHTVSAWFAEGTLQEVVEVVCVVTSARCSIGDGVVTIQRGMR